VTPPHPPRTPVVAVAMLAAALGATPSGATITQVHYVMGTYLRVVVDDDVSHDAVQACFERARALDRTYSRFDPTSELARLNASGGGPASAEFRWGLARALALTHDTARTFDVTVGALTALWRLPEPPTAAAVAAARRTLGGAVVDGDRVVLAPGTRLDFDGFAKGIAVDACVAALRGAGVTRALVSFGESSLYGLGAPRDAEGWMLDVRGPEPDVSRAQLVLRDAAAAVSATRSARGRAHIVDPRSGRAVTADAVGVVVATSAADAEAYAKAVLVDEERGLAAVETHPDVRAARFTRDRVVAGPAMRASRLLRTLAQPRSLAPDEDGLR